MKTTNRVDYTEQKATEYNGETVVEDVVHLNDISFVPYGRGTKDIEIVSGKDAVRNVVESVVSTCRGELQMDKTAGIPYFETVFGRKDIDLTEWAGFMQNAITHTNGVMNLTGFSYSPHKSTSNRMGVEYTASILTSFGTTTVSNAK